MASCEMAGVPRCERVPGAAVVSRGHQWEYGVDGRHAACEGAGVCAAFEFSKHGFEILPGRFGHPGVPVWPTEIGRSFVLVGRVRVDWRRQRAVLIGVVASVDAPRIEIPQSSAPLVARCAPG